MSIVPGRDLTLMVSGLNRGDSSPAIGSVDAVLADPTEAIAQFDNVVVVRCRFGPED